MRISFRGFKGFGEDSNFLDITKLTLLTGKNSSGKSTFIKLLQLLSESISELKDLHDLINLEINIGNEIIGGKENLQSIGQAQPKLIFSVPFVFFNDYHEVHINFDINDYLLRIKSIEIFDSYCLEVNSPFISIYNEVIKVNVKYISSVYNKYAELFNLNETLLENKRTKDKVLYDNSIDLIQKYKSRNGLTDSEMNHLIENHYESRSFPFKNIDKSKPFAYESKNVNLLEKFYMLNLMNFDSIELAKEEAIKLLPEFEKWEVAQRYISDRINYEPDFDFFYEITEYCNREFSNLIISCKEFDYFEIEAELERMNELNIRFAEEPFVNTIDAYYDADEYLFFPSWVEFYPKALFDKYKIANEFAASSCRIFQESIIDFFNSLKELRYQSNIRTLPERSFNIFNSSNVFSAFIKGWKILDSEKQVKRKEFLKYFLNEFEIADDLDLFARDNIGFLKLIKGKHSFSLIDEGSGISNILGLLLFLSNHIDNDRIWSHTYRSNKILLIEEPEANLHPSLQSKLGLLFMDFVKQYEVNIIVETHSEYLIRKIQYLIANQDIRNNDVSLNYFSLSSNNNIPSIEIRKIPISNDGRLQTEFGPGFFDEADKLAIDLFLLQKTKDANG